ncbi:MAG: SDR family oxidoreductase [Sphingomonadales bacterium]|nr:SDR family oxidoreductase [Sphingomonadales bacterium]MBU3991833.1 SDR family oxidoreductase [Alphaproteobacteria bacterium]
MPENLFDLTGKVALVTGANSGLGLAMAEGLARAGADVAIWGRRADRNAAAAEQVRRHGGRVATSVVDVANEQDVIDGFAAAVAELGRVDCVIANAGGAGVAPIEQMTSETWHGLLAVNLHGAFYTCREAARHMQARAAAGDPGGSIILNGSLSVFTGVPGLSHYATAKGGLNALSKTLAVELGVHGVRVNTICPGFIPTEISAGADVQPLIDATLARSPIKQIGRPEDLQGIVVYLASDRSRYHSGDTITLDGGMMAQCY